MMRPQRTALALGGRRPTIHLPAPSPPPSLCSPRQDYSSMATFSLDGTRQPRTAFTRVAARWYSSLVPAMARVKTDDAAGKPDRSVADVYGAWLKQQSQFTPADVATANVMMHTNWQSLLNGNVTALSAARLGDAKVRRGSCLRCAHHLTACCRSRSAAHTLLTLAHLLA